MRWRAGVVVVAAIGLSGCASSGMRGLSVKEEMRLGAQAAGRGYWQEALFRFERARAAAPQEAQVLGNLAVALEAMGRYDEALAAYRQALQIAPRNTTIKRNYARFAEFFTSYARGAKPKGAADAKR